jgi:hypothetical protein
MLSVVCAIQFSYGAFPLIDIIVNMCSEIKMYLLFSYLFSSWPVNNVSIFPIHRRSIKNM